MGRGTLYELTDRQYLRRDGKNEMTGQLPLAGDPAGDNDATRKAYVDALVGAIDSLTPTQIAALIAVLTTPGGTIDVRIAAAVAAYLPLAGGTMTGIVTLSGAPVGNLDAATKAYVDAGAHLTPYDAVVAAAGGDYTSVVAACAGEAVGARIFIKSGTYLETANVDMQDGQQLIGENPDNTIIDFGAANRKITFTGACENLHVEGLTVQGSQANYTIELQGSYNRVDNCRLIGSALANEGVYLFGSRSLLTRTHFTDFTKAGTYCARIQSNSQVIGNYFRNSRRACYLGNNTVFIGNYIDTLTEEQLYLLAGTVVSNNQLLGNKAINIAGVGNTITGNRISGANGIQWAGAHDYQVITGNNFDSSAVYNTNTGVQEVTVSGNVFEGGSGVYTAGQRWAISGNTFQAAASIILTANAKYCSIVGNNLAGSSAAATVLIDDSGVGNTAKDNVGVAATLEKHFTKVNNGSGGALVAGDCVVLNAIAAGNDFTTTVNQGDDLVYGMLDENIGNGATGYVQDEGKTTRLKVNGTAAIAIGDFLGTFTAAGIAMKAAAGDMGFAIALEAYAVADSLGVIDALLVSPRKI